MSPTNGGLYDFTMVVTCTVFCVRRRHQHLAAAGFAAVMRPHPHDAVHRLRRVLSGHADRDRHGLVVDHLVGGDRALDVGALEALIARSARATTPGRQDQHTQRERHPAAGCRRQPLPSVSRLGQRRGTVGHGVQCISRRQVRITGMHAPDGTIGL